MTRWRRLNKEDSRSRQDNSVDWSPFWEVIIKKGRRRWGSKSMGTEQDNFPFPYSFIPRNESIYLAEFKLVQYHL